MKIYWHTKTLFLKWNKYKWSYKYEFCIDCKRCDNIHKWNGRCVKCWDKNRNKSEKRKIKNKLTSIKYQYKTRILKWIEQTEKKKKMKVFDEKKYKQEYYQKNKEVLLLIKKWNKLKKLWWEFMYIFIWGKMRILPFKTLKKPKPYNKELYEQWRENIKQFSLLKKYWLKQ